MPPRDSRINQKSNPRIRGIATADIDRSIDRYWPAIVARAGARRNVGSDCLVGGTRERPRFLLTFRKYKVFRRARSRTPTRYRA